MVDEEEKEEESQEGESQEEAVEEIDQAAAQALMIDKLKQRIEALKRINLTQKDKFKTEVRNILQPLLQKHKDLQKENNILKQQINELSKNRLNVQTSDTQLNQFNDIIEEQKQEISVLQRMTKDLEEEILKYKHELAVIPELKQKLLEKNTIQKNLEEQILDLKRELEAKEIVISKISKEKVDTESRLLVLQKKLEGNFEENQDESKIELEKANKRINELQQQVNELQDSLNHHKEIIETVINDLIDQSSMYDDIVLSLSDTTQLMDINLN